MVCSIARFDVSFCTVFLKYVQIILATFWKIAAHSVYHKFSVYLVCLLF